MMYYHCHFTLAGVPCRDGSWGTQGEMEAEKGMCSKPAECPLSPEKAVMARSLVRALGLPERVTSLGVSEWLVVGEGRGKEGKGQHPSSH